MPVEQVGESIKTFKEEGKPYETITKKYERSQINRAACIEIHGLCCKVCGILFKEKYGEIGSDFIHVHHLEPLSTMEESYCVDPANDIIPVCPNCHAMMHRKNPPYTPEELNSLIENNKK